MATLDPATQGPDRRAGVSRRRLIVVGGGEHAAVVIDAARSDPDAWEPRGFTDPSPTPDASSRLGLDHLGEDGAVAARLAADGSDASWLVLGFGSPVNARRDAVRHFPDSARWATLVHRVAWVSPSAALGEGAVVLAGAVVNAGAAIGRHVIVNTRAVIEHDVRIGDFAHVAPGAVIGGGATVGADAFIGLGGLVRDHVTIGAGATVGMGAVVVDDVPAGATVAGSPARPLDSVDGAANR
jgi:sugar O-acyltransferase (sialic acid O-acetyltransferase NeuD family)